MFIDNLTNWALAPFAISVFSDSHDRGLGPTKKCWITSSSLCGLKKKEMCHQCKGNPVCWIYSKVDYSHIWEKESGLELTIEELYVLLSSVLSRWFYWLHVHRHMGYLLFAYGPQGTIWISWVWILWYPWHTFLYSTIGLLIIGL